MSGEKGTLIHLTEEQMKEVASNLTLQEKRLEYNKWKDSRKFLITIILLLFFISLFFFAYYIMKVDEELQRAILWSIPTSAGLYFGTNVIQKFSEKGK